MTFEERAREHEAYVVELLAARANRGAAARCGLTPLTG